MSADIFRHVCNIERPKMLIRGLLDALNMIDLAEPEARAVYAVVSAALTSVTEIDAEYATLFRLTHPDRERFDREGWPTDRKANEDTGIGDLDGLIEQTARAIE